MEAERRQVTVLFTDMVGFTSFSERAGEEAAFALMRSLSKLRALHFNPRGHLHWLYRKGSIPRSIAGRLTDLSKFKIGHPADDLKTLCSIGEGSGARRNAGVTRFDQTFEVIAMLAQKYFSDFRNTRLLRWSAQP